MGGRAWLCALGVALLVNLGAAPAAHAAPPSRALSRASTPTIVVSLRPIANFAYQLDCISGWIRSCGGRGDYVALWQQHFGVDAAQSLLIASWRDAFARSSDLARRARIASFEATSLDDYLRRIDAVFPRQDAAAVHTAANRWYPAFRRWWARDPGRARARRVRQLRDALDTSPVIDDLPRLYRFFVVPPDSSRVLHLALFYRPLNGQPQQSSGEYLSDDWSVAEFAPTENIGNRIDVIVHEYTHYVFAKMPAAERKTLHDAITADPEHGAAAWSLFNESVATAVGNGRTYRAIETDTAWKAYLARDKSFYLDGPIDTAAKAILPLVDATLDGSGTVTSTPFTRAYLAALNAHLGDLWQAPSLVLGEFWMLGDDRFDKSIFDNAIGAFHAYSVWYDKRPCCGTAFEQWWADGAEMSRVVVIHKDNAAKTRLLSPELAARYAALSEGQAGYTIARHGAFTDIVIVAGSVEAAETLFDGLAHVPALVPGQYTVSSPVGDTPADAGIVH